MNASSLDELRAVAADHDNKDEKMEQVRQLLFGDHAREVSTRFMLLETRLRELETGVARQLESLSQRVEALAQNTSNDRRAAFAELAQNIQELGERIGTLSRK